VLGDASLLAQAAGDLQPGAIGRFDHRQRRRGVVDLPQILEQRAAVVALREMHLELGTADRSDGAVDHLVDRIDELRTRHG